MKAWQFWAVYSGVTALVYYLSTENLQAPLFFLASLVVSSLIFRWFTREQRREERLRLLCLALWMGRDVAHGRTARKHGRAAARNRFALPCPPQREGVDSGQDGRS
jgi:hypothetical protein